MRFIIQAPARIHMTLIDLNGALGRIDGGIGFGIKDPHYRIEFTTTNKLTKDQEINEPEYGFFKDIHAQFLEKFKIQPKDVSIRILETIPNHFGFGSKTQLFMTFATGLAKIYEIKPSLREICSLINRGGTSGIGYQVFNQGGFHFDLGHSFGEGMEKSSFTPSSASHSAPALPFFRTEFPENWKIFLLIPALPEGASNLQEIDIFQSYTPIPQKDVEKITHHIVFQLIPGILNQNLQCVAKALHFINTHGFKKIEISLQHSIISHLIHSLYKKFSHAIGLSSFGPSLYVIVPKEFQLSQFQNQVSQLLHSIPQAPKIEIIETFPNNHGYFIEPEH